MNVLTVLIASILKLLMQSLRRVSLILGMGLLLGHILDDIWCYLLALSCLLLGLFVDHQEQG